MGKSLPLRDAYEKVTGKAKYAADIRLPNLLFGKVLGSIYPHAIIKNINIEKALKVPGVKAVITKKNLWKNEIFHPTYTRPMHPLTDHARCLGDILAAVAAETEEDADRALELIEVDYEVLPAVFDPKEAMKPDAPKLYPEGNISDPEGKPERLEWGDVEQGFKEAQVIVEGTFKMPMVLHAAIEPRACVAKFDNNKLTLWASTQMPHQLRQMLADYFEIPLENIDIITDYVGGGFGGKYHERYFLIAALLAKETGKPVKIEYTREEEAKIGRRRYAVIVDGKVGAKRDGSLIAVYLKFYFDVGAYGSPEGGSGYTFGAMNASLYKTENFKVEAFNVNTNTITAQKFRSVYVTAYRFAIEQLMDELEEKLGLKPGECRLKNFIYSGEKIPPYGNTMGPHNIQKCFRKAIEAIKWEKRWKGWSIPVKITGSKRRGLGIAFGVGWCGDWFQTESGGCTVKVYPDGRVDLIIGVTDIGCGCLTSIPQIVAEVLCLNSIERLRVISGAKGQNPFDYGTVASKTLFVGGLAAKLAAEKVKRKILEIAASKLNEESGMLDIEEKDSFIFIYSKRKPENRISLSELIKKPVVEGAFPPSPKFLAAKRVDPYAAPVQVHIAEVEIDMETMEVQVVKYVAAHDVGKAINPAIVKNQIYGGVIQGISTTLYEELIFDTESNVYLNPDFLDYKIATITDIPEIDAIIVEEDDVRGPFGAKGVGEHSLTPVSAAIANAVYNAIGIRFKEIPITPEKIFEKLKKKD